jgi:hypothetical protein
MGLAPAAQTPTNLTPLEIIGTAVSQIVETTFQL